jgi:hypothetical protein
LYEQDGIDLYRRDWRMETVQMSSRHRELLAIFEHHFETERQNDIEACMKTLAPDIVYEHPFRPGPDYLLVGTEAVRDYYTRHWGAQPFEKIELLRSWLSGDDTLLVEVQTTVRKPSGLETARTFAMGIFRDGLLAKEITMSGPWTPVT